MYPREMIIKSERFKAFGVHEDILRALLPNKSYSLDDAEKIIKEYLER